MLRLIDAVEVTRVFINFDPVLPIAIDSQTAIVGHSELYRM